jgi:hypothetical protein
MIIGIWLTPATFPKRLKKLAAKFLDDHHVYIGYLLFSATFPKRLKKLAASDHGQISNCHTGSVRANVKPQVRGKGSQSEDQPVRP